MPILACITLGIIAYNIFLYIIKVKYKRLDVLHEQDSKIFLKLDDSEKYEVIEKCFNCKRDLNKNWRSCPYCGSARGIKEMSN